MGDGVVIARDAPVPSFSDTIPSGSLHATTRMTGVEEDLLNNQWLNGQSCWRTLRRQVPGCRGVDGRTINEVRRMKRSVEAAKPGDGGAVMSQEPGSAV